MAKYFDLKTLDLNIDNYLQNFYKSLNIKNDSEFKQYLRNNDISFNYLKKKIQIEIIWNQLIYDKYNTQINIDKKKLKKKLKELNKE